MKKALFGCLLGVFAVSATAQQEKPTLKFGGRVEMIGAVDTYVSKTKNNGLYYFYPLAPDFSPSGKDLNFSPSAHLGVASSRLNATLQVPDILGGVGRGFVETDFMGTSDATFSMIRLRHAYMAVAWEGSELLLGQTDHLSIATELGPNTVSYAGGSPINPLCRMPQIRYTQQLGDQLKLSMAAGFFTGAQRVAQENGLLPDLQVKFSWGDPKQLFFGIGAGYKSIRPRTVTAADEPTYRRVGAFNAEAFAGYVFDKGYTLRLYGIWGQDLSQLSMMGGYAPLKDDTRDDYDYSTIGTVAGWLDFDTPLFHGFQGGLFLGIERNLGSQEDVDLTRAVLPEQGVNFISRVAPRAWFHHKNLSFGLEYMYSMAGWAQAFDDQYRPEGETLNTFDHRVTLLARFKF